MAFRAKADFSEVVKAAEEASKKVGDLFSKGMSSSLGGTSFRAQFAKLDALQRRHEEDRKKFLALQSKITTREHVLELQRTGKLQEAREKAEVELDKIRAKFARAVEQRDQKEIDNLKQQRKVHEEIVDLAKEYQKDAGKFASDLKVASKEFDGLVGSLKTVTARSNFFTGITKSITDAIEGGFEGAGDKITGLAENLGDAFVSGIDVTSLTKKITSGVGKGLGKAGDSLRSLVGGKVGAGLGAIVGVIGASVGALGALVAAFIAVDKKVKEFNKDTIKTYGALSVMRLGAGDLNKGLRILSHTVSNLTANFGLSEEDAKTLFSSLDNGNITLARITGGTRDADEAQRRLNAALRDTYTAANVTGTTLSEYTDNLTNYVNDLGMSTQTVNDNFRSIAKMASESGFSTRRFYSMVVQATAGQSSLNVSLDHTGDLLLRMSKIMGMKKAAEMVGTAAGGMGQMGASERIKTLLVAGGRGENIFRRQAVQSAGDFTRGNRGLAGEFTAALRRAGLTGRGIEEAFSNSNPRALVQSLGQLSATDQRKMLTELRQSGVTGADEMARQLEEITNLSRGGLGSRVGAAGALGAGANLQMQASMLRRFMDPSGRLSAQQRVAAESVTGLGGPQMDAFLSLMQAMQGEFEAMGRRGDDGRPTATALKLMEKYGLSPNSQGTLVDQLGHEIRSSDDLFMTQTAQQAHEASRLQEEATGIAYQTVDATVSLVDILENKVARYIQHVYEWLNGYLGPLLLKLPGLGSEREAFERKRATTTEIDKKIAELTEGSSEARKRMARLQVQAHSSTATETQRRTAQDALAKLTGEQQQRETQTQALRNARDRIASGTYDTRAFEVRTPYGNHSFATREQALAKEAELSRQGRLGSVGAAGHAVHEVQMSPQRVLDRVLTRAGLPARGTPGAAAVAPTATPAAAASQSAAAAPTPTHAAAANAPTVAAVQEQHEDQRQQTERSRRETRQQNLRTNQNMEKLIKGKELGDGLAMSKLPDAIAEADAKMRLLEGIYANGASSASNDVVARLMGGTATDQDLAMAGAGGATARALRFRHITQAPDVHDFISQDRGGRTVITPIDRADQVMGMKAGGPVANAGGRGGGNVNISIHGGDERRVFNVVRRAIQQAGITPNRVPGGG